MSILQKPFRYTYFNAVIYLIIINVIIFVLQFSTRRIFNLTALLALNPAFVIKNGTYWQFITYMFAHDVSGFTHILFNMLALFIFGVPLERRIGSKEFILYYMTTGVLAGVLSFAVFIITGNYFVFLIGASGAIFAVQLAYAAFFPESVIYIWGILPLRAPIMVLLFTGIELFSGLFGFNSGVAHLTHLFGFAVGFAYFILRWRMNPFKLMFRR
jgi:membrane associated rhomboid family serine protease